MSNIADALDWLCRLLHSYGFMLHHRGISFSVDYNSQKPLIKSCAAKAFCLGFFFLELFSCEWERSPQIYWPSLPQQQRGPTGQAPHKLLNPTEQFALTEVCLWGTFSSLNRLTCLITAWGVCVHKTLLTLMTLIGILVRPRLCLAFSGGDLISSSAV